MTAVDPRTLDLIHAEIDGIISEGERSRLQDLLAGDAAAREYLARMIELTETLAGVKEVAPPDGLRRDIMSSVRAARMQPGGGTRSWLQPLWPGRRALLRYGYAFAAGLILGLSGIHWYVTETMDVRPVASSEVAGTITAPGIPSGSEVVQQSTLEMSDLGGTVILLRSESGFDLVFNLDATGEKGPARVALAYNPLEASFTGFDQVRGQVRDFQAAGGELSWEMLGHHETAIHFKAWEEAGPVIELRFFVGGAPVQSLSLKLAGSP